MTPTNTFGSSSSTLTQQSQEEITKLRQTITSLQSQWVTLGRDNMKGMWTMHRENSEPFEYYILQGNSNCVLTSLLMYVVQYNLLKLQI